MTEPRDESIRAERIVVAFDTSPLGDAALEAAAALAAALGAEIAGLFVEDLDLVRMAALPFTRELGLISAVTRPIDTPDIERAFRLQAQQTRGTLEALAAELNLRWSFQIIRGQVLSAVMECVREPDVVVFGKAAHGAAARSAWPELMGSRRRGPFSRLAVRPVAVLFDDSPRAWRTLAAAHSLAGEAGARLALLIPARSTKEFEQLRDRAKKWLVAQDAAARFVRLKSREAGEVARAVSSEHAAVLLWHDEDARGEQRGFRALIGALRCPLVLVT